ncbi:MAG: hypothetical protein ABL900_22945 [Burkholderiaceae bacterium]
MSASPQSGAGATWQHGPQEELTPEGEQEIVEEVRKVRAERRMRGAS